MDVAKAITNRLNDKGWNQEKLAAKAGITAAGISHIVNGNRQINLVTLIKIAEALSIKPWRILKEADQL